MEERTSTLKEKALSGQKNTYRKCQGKGGTKCLQFVPLSVVSKSNSRKIVCFLGEQGNQPPHHGKAGYSCQNCPSKLEIKSLASIHLHNQATMLTMHFPCVVSQIQSPFPVPQSSITDNQVVYVILSLFEIHN